MNRDKFFKGDKSYHLVDEISLIHRGQAYFDALEKLILEAKHTLQIQNYIWDEDETGMRVFDAVLAAAQKGVKIYIVVDGFGTKHSKQFIQHLEAVGVHYRVFVPMFSSQNLYIGRRMHHKIVVADQYTTLIGGLNFANKYSGYGYPYPWLDFAVLLKGPVGIDADRICAQVYGRRFIKFLPQMPPARHTANTPPILARIRRNDGLRKKFQVSKSYLEAIKHAQHSIILVTPYFLPGLKMRMALAKAARRGVTVKLLISGVDDLPMFYRATRFLYRFLFRNGIAVYSWPTSVLHGKVGVVDQRWATIGSYNLNYLSAYASVELNADILNDAFCQQFDAELNELLVNECIEINPMDYLQKTSWLQLFKMWASYLFVRTMIKLLVVFPGVLSLRASKYERY